MKLIWKILALIKFLWLPPLVATIVWFLSTLISSFVRYLPQLLEKLYFFCAQNLGDQNIVTMCLQAGNDISQFVHKVFFGINCWLPLDVAVSAFIFCLSFRFKFNLIRIFIKLVTLGRL